MIPFLKTERFYDHACSQRVCTGPHSSAESVVLHYVVNVLSVVNSVSIVRLQALPSRHGSGTPSCLMAGAALSSCLRASHVRGEIFRP